MGVWGELLEVCEPQKWPAPYAVPGGPSRSPVPGHPQVPEHQLPSRAWQHRATPTPCLGHSLASMWWRAQAWLTGPWTRWACGSGSLERRSPGAAGNRPSRPPGPRAASPAQPSQALENISETSAAEHFPVYLLPNTGIWEPAEREIRNKCGGGLDRNSAAALPRGPRGPWASR